MTDKTLGNARGLNSIADPRDFKGASRRRPAETPTSNGDDAHPVDEAVPPPPPPEPTHAAAPHRAVVPGVSRKRRELSVPHPVAEAVERTGINPADVVMAGYRKHSDAIYAGGGGRIVARGRTRLRLSISDAEFDQITRLGQARGWNRSETVSVILAMELLGVPADPSEASPVV